MLPNLVLVCSQSCAEFTFRTRAAVLSHQPGSVRLTSRTDHTASSRPGLARSRSTRRVRTLLDPPRPLGWDSLLTLMGRQHPLRHRTWPLRRMARVALPAKGLHSRGRSIRPASGSPAARRHLAEDTATRRPRCTSSTLAGTPRAPSRSIRLLEEAMPVWSVPLRHDPLFHPLPIRRYRPFRSFP